MRYFRGEDYEGICDNCKRAIDDAWELIIDGYVSEEYINDNEGPSMLAYDKGWFCKEC